MTERSVVIVGAGPSGCATALALAAQGIPSTMLDRAAFPRDKPCAEYLSPEASRVLHSLGVLEDVESASPAHLAGMTVRAPRGATLVGSFAGCAESFHPFRARGLALQRRILDAILVERARRAGVMVRERTHVTDLLRDAHGAVCGVRVREPDGSVREQRSWLVVGADGLRSVVARRARLARRGRWPRRVAMVAHFRGVREMGDYGEMHVERDGYAGLARVSGADDLVNVSVVVPARRLRHARAAGAGGLDAVMRAWLSAHPQLAPRFAHAERVSPVLATGPFASQARRAWAPGVALVGDAADFFDPFTGEGIYTALRGGELLAQAVVAMARARDTRGEHAALRAYDAERRRVFGGKWSVERLVGLAVGWPLLMNRVARTLEQYHAMADLFVGVAGDFVPARVVLNPAFLGALLIPALARRYEPPMRAAGTSAPGESVVPHRP
ncbi:MAG TPA: NAD(P)/FAD-dependent oxidoreductase [Gemmatimonadaceae bacterium]|nr:NAD(P)/FAD-dependent oxidoreductase [Gemmatimonadaceae bacterium]